MPARSLDQIVSLSKRRGFVFPGSAAYGGLGSFWDYGPLGAELMRNVKDAWWKAMTWERDDIEGVDCAILMNRKVWQHSGHEATFSDPLVDNKKTGKRYRLDHLLNGQPQPLLGRLLANTLEVWNITYEGSHQEEVDELKVRHSKELDLLLEELLKDGGADKSDEIFASPSPVIRAVLRRWRAIKARNPEIQALAKAQPKTPGNAAEQEKAELNELFEILRDGQYPRHEVGQLVDAWMPLFMNFVGLDEDLWPLNSLGVTDPHLGQAGEWTYPRRFNLMFSTRVGAVSDDSSLAYLRPETAQGIFMNFKNVLDSSRRKLPFGIAQIGKAFRNEITPGNFTFRTREFEQMELEFFIKPPQFLREGEKTDEQWHAEWVDARYRWWISLGIDTSRLRKRAQDKSELAHYAKATTDLEYLFPGSLGWGEVEGVANRTDFDLSAHSREVPEADLKRLKLEANKDSVTTLDYFDTEAKARYIPWVIEPSAGATRAALTFLCEAYHEEMVKEPPQAEIEALKTEIDAVIKNADKKKKDAEKEKDPAQRKHDPVAISAFQAALAEAASRLPASLMEIDTMLEDHAGAQNLEPVKKLKPKVNKLAEDCVRVVLKLHPKLAPVKVAVFPLARNKPELVDIAQRVSRELRHFCKAIYDDSAGIGKLYRRQDEIGTPLCVTVDHQTLEDNMVTVRDRDTMDQVRISLEQLPHEIRRRLQLH